MLYNFKLAIFINIFLSHVFTLPTWYPSDALSFSLAHSICLFIKLFRSISLFLSHSLSLSPRHFFSLKNHNTFSRHPNTLFFWYISIFFGTYPNTLLIPSLVRDAPLEKSQNIWISGRKAIRGFKSTLWDFFFPYSWF